MGIRWFEFSTASCAVCGRDAIILVKLKLPSCLLRKVTVTFSDIDGTLVHYPTSAPGEPYEDDHGGITQESVHPGFSLYTDKVLLCPRMMLHWCRYLSSQHSRRWTTASVRRAGWQAA